MGIDAVVHYAVITYCAFFLLLAFNSFRLIIIMACLRNSEYYEMMLYVRAAGRSPDQALPSEIYRWSTRSWKVIDLQWLYEVGYLLLIFSTIKWASIFGKSSWKQINNIKFTTSQQINLKRICELKSILPYPNQNPLFFKNEISKLGYQILILYFVCLCKISESSISTVLFCYTLYNQ